MINPGSILSLLFLHLSFVGISQSDTINRIDANGFKQGYWIVYGAYQPERGFCDTCKIEEGYYIDGKKNGEWTMYHKDGRTPRLVGTFVNGRPQGEYVKTGPPGKIIETGGYINGKQVGPFRRYYESGCLAFEKNYNTDGKEEGWSIFYYDNCDAAGGELVGSLEKQFQKTDGIPFGTGEYFYPSGCTKELVYYGENGAVINSQVLSDDCPDSLRHNLKFNSNILVRSIDGGKTFMPDPVDRFNPNGVNKLYYENGNLFMEGQFKDGKLWDGKVYSYDDDGVLTKIEVWKNGVH